MKKIIVASANPIKIETALNGFKRMFPRQKFEIQGYETQSGVSDQPITEEETLQGALNRASKVRETHRDGDFYVGIESGLEEYEGRLKSFGWVVVINKAGKFGEGRTGTFFLPPRVADLISQGYELGEADDIVFGMTNSKQSKGAIGILTGGVLSRASFYETAVITALIPFKNPDLY